MENKNPFQNLANNWQQQIAEFARDAGIKGMEHFQGSFRKQGFTDASFEKWKDRNPILIKKKGTYISKPNDPGRAILVGKQSGILRRSLRHFVSGTTITFLAGNDSIPYAQIHNEGGTIRTRNGKTFFRMHKRQYMGESKTLNTEIGEMFEKRMDKLFQ